MKVYNTIEEFKKDLPVINNHLREIEQDVINENNGRHNQKQINELQDIYFEQFGTHFGALVSCSNQISRQRSKIKKAEKELNKQVEYSHDTCTNNIQQALVASFQNEKVNAMTLKMHLEEKLKYIFLAYRQENK